jgi:hypothetical protein
MTLAEKKIQGISYKNFNLLILVISYHCKISYYVSLYQSIKLSFKLYRTSGVIFFFIDYCTVIRDT